jgi:hypothetical protein
VIPLYPPVLRQDSDADTHRCTAFGKGETHGSMGTHNTTVARTANTDRQTKW